MSNRCSLFAMWYLVGMLAVAMPARTLAGCSGSEKVGAGDTASVTVRSSASLRKLDPSYFGFSFVWVEFQESLWNEAAGRVDVEAIQWMKGFRGAVYRYPGGTESNYFDWKAAIGPKDQRTPRKAVKWKDPLVARFGIDEYLAFVREVAGQPWYVANLYGAFGQESDPQRLAIAAGELAANLRDRGAPLRWELGNELDRGEYGWSVGKYVAVGRRVAEAIRHADPQARFVAIMEDYDAHWRWKRMRAADYNREVANGLSDLASEYAQHSYYDGHNVEVPQTVPSRIAHICQSIQVAEAAKPAPGPVGIWVTEHARQPVKSARDAEWRPTWSHSANLEAALGVADFMIAATQIADVKGVFVHALHGLDAPWPMFHKNNAGTQTYPSVVFHALHLLRQGLEPEVLLAETHSPNRSNYAGGYDLRATVMANAARTRWAVWAVNRSDREQAVTLRISALAGRHMRAGMRVLGDENLKANNYVDGKRLQPRDLAAFDLTFGTDGSAVVAVAPQSVMVVRFEAK